MSIRHKNINQTKIMNAQELRNKTKEMSKQDFINYRDHLEKNWNDTLRPLMQIISLACINKFGTTISNL